MPGGSGTGRGVDHAPNRAANARPRGLSRQDAPGARTRGDYLVTARTNGGSTLSARPDKLTLLQVVAAVESDTAGEYVIARHRGSNANLRTHLNRIIRKAGLEPWPKLFHNLRSTRETELCEEYPDHVVVAWIGNSVKIALADHRRALRKSGAETGAVNLNQPHSTSCNCAARSRRRCNWWRRKCLQP
jgi:hypothetical protein